MYTLNIRGWMSQSPKRKTITTNYVYNKMETHCTLQKLKKYLTKLKSFNSVLQLVWTSSKNQLQRQRVIYLSSNCFKSYIKLIFELKGLVWHSTPAWYATVAKIPGDIQIRHHAWRAKGLCGFGALGFPCS